MIAHAQLREVVSTGAGGTLVGDFIAYHDGPTASSADAAHVEPGSTLR